jgi:prolyl oligopeptidase
MSKLIKAPPCTSIDTVTDVLHGVPLSDPYRWLEDQESQRTRLWLAAQTLYAREHLDAIPGRERVRERVRELLDVETYDSLQKFGQHYFFRKRVRGQQQPSICFRHGFKGQDNVLIDPASRNTGPHTAVRIACISPDHRFLLYEVKEGGERSGTFEVLDVENREILRDRLPRGYLRGIAFAPDSNCFYYVHQPLRTSKPVRHVVYRHLLGSDFAGDFEVFVAGEGENLRLAIVPGSKQLGFLTVRFSDSVLVDFHLWNFEELGVTQCVIRGAPYKFGPRLLEDGRILAITDRDAPNMRIVEVHVSSTSDPVFTDVVANSGSLIQDWAVSGKKVYVSYLRNLQTEINIFDLSGQRLGQVPTKPGSSTRIIATGNTGDELLLEQESFVDPLQINSYAPGTGKLQTWARRRVDFASDRFDYQTVSFPSKDGTLIPMFLVGRTDSLARGIQATIMTSYGGYGIPATPQFSVFVALLLERGCLFALPRIRGGGEFGVEWHKAAQRRNRQVAFDDFLSAADWLVATKRSQPGRLAIFGGSNSGLLVGAALTQRPELFRAVVCVAPLLDMVRYHLFDGASAWKSEFGTSDDPEDFAALARYSPYHNVHDGIAYPATMLVSGDADQNCNPLHARKMTARLQAANVSGRAVLLDYSPHRGHSPVLPLNDRISALTDRVSFLCDELQLNV